jgi:DNA-binding FrmR family transcriptional regulator
MSATGGLHGPGKARGIGEEFAAAAGATEIPGMDAMLGMMRRLGGIDGHAADGIDRRCGRPGFLRRFNGFVQMRAPAMPGDGVGKVLVMYTLGGYSVKTMKPKTQASCRSRLRRIEGQVRGIERMIDEERYCIDILTQLQAVRAALKKVEDEVLKDHVEHCVHDAIRGGKTEEQFEKINELLQVLEKRTT